VSGLIAVTFAATPDAALNLMPAVPIAQIKKTRLCCSHVAERKGAWRRTRV